MDKIELLNEIKEGYENLQYQDRTELDKINRRLKMLINNLYSSSSEYIRDLQSISYSAGVYYRGMPESKLIEAWESGKSKSINLTDTIIEEQNLFFSNSEKKGVEINELDKSYTTVFIVHGHDDGAKNEVARFIEKLDLKAIILHEQVNSGATIIEKLEAHTNVGFAIVIYTACDIGAVKTKPDELKLRARQNVVFEHGLMIGKIGRSNVVALVKDDVEIPNDISGVVYETMDSSGAWKYKLAREMKASGYDVDMNKI